MNIEKMRETGRKKITSDRRYDLNTEDIAKMIVEHRQSGGDIDSIVTAYYIGIERGYRMATRKGTNHNDRL